VAAGGCGSVGGGDEFGGLLVWGVSLLPWIGGLGCAGESCTGVVLCCALHRLHAVDVTALRIAVALLMQESGQTCHAHCEHSCSCTQVCALACVICKCTNLHVTSQHPFLSARAAALHYGLAAGPAGVAVRIEGKSLSVRA
jgi:hypothetical protein